MKVDITVTCRPDDIEFICPHCEIDVSVPYSCFMLEMGEPCDWEYSSFDCPVCEERLEVDDVEWD